MLAIALFRFGGGNTLPWNVWFGRLGRLLLGVAIGSAFDMDVIRPLQTAAGPMVVAVVILLGTGMFLGWMLHKVTGLNLSSGLIASVPGGLPAMVSIASETEADTTVVAALHVTRLTLILLLIPALMIAIAEPVESASDPGAIITRSGLWTTAAALSIGAVSGLASAHLGVPTGDMMGPLIVIGAANLLGAGLGPVPAVFRRLGLILIGISTGAQVSKESFGQMKRVAVPALGGILLLTGVGLLLGWGISQATDIDLITALLSCAPGGASTLSAVASDLGGDVPIVAALHFVRQVAVFMIMPPLLSRILPASQCESEIPKAA
jgi:hypothetical protein